MKCDLNVIPPHDQHPGECYHFAYHAVTVIEIPPHDRTLKILTHNGNKFNKYTKLPYSQFYFTKHNVLSTQSNIPLKQIILNNQNLTIPIWAPNLINASEICWGGTYTINPTPIELINIFWNSTFDDTMTLKINSPIKVKKLYD